MSVAEFREWQAFRRIEPSTNEILLAILEAAAVTASAYDKRTLHAEDFLPKLKPPGPFRQSAAAGKAILKGIAARMRAKQDKRRERP